MAIMWAGRILQNPSIDTLCADDADTFWYTFILGWLESINNFTEFTKRDAFPHTWYRSKYGLINFSRSEQKRIKPLF